MPHHPHPNSLELASSSSASSKSSIALGSSSASASSSGVSPFAQPSVTLQTESREIQERRSTKNNKKNKSKGKNDKKDKPDTPSDPLEEYFIQQAKLFRHLEKRYNKFQIKAREAQARIKENRLKYKNGTRFTFKPQYENDKARVDQKREQDSYSDTSSEEDKHEDKMIGSTVIRGAGLGARSVAQRPSISVTRVASPAASASASASFSTSSPTAVRHSALKKKKTKKVANPDAMTAIEATRVLRALDISNPRASYSLELTTKSTKSSLPVRGHFQLPLDPRRSSETILVFVEPSSPSVTLAKEAGAAYVGGEELYEQVLSGKIAPTRVLATPGMMTSVTRSLARFLGPKGLMPVAKRGSVGEGEELAQKIRDAAGRLEYRADKQGLVRIPVARIDFEVPSVDGNIRSFVQTVRRDQAVGSSDDAVTAAAKKKKKGGSSITTVRLESTNGPSIELNDVL